MPNMKRRVYSVLLLNYLYVGLIIMVDDTTNLTSWFLSADDETQTFNGVELSKSNESLIVSYKTGITTATTTAADCNIDVKYDFYYIHAVHGQWRTRISLMIFAVLDVSLNKRP